MLSEIARIYSAHPHLSTLETQRYGLVCQSYLTKYSLASTVLADSVPRRSFKLNQTSLSMRNSSLEASSRYAQHLLVRVYTTHSSATKREMLCCMVIATLLIQWAVMWLTLHWKCCEIWNWVTAGNLTEMTGKKAQHLKPRRLKEWQYHLIPAPIFGVHGQKILLRRFRTVGTSKA